MRFRRKLRQRVGIDMTPMIDCVFLLLIFFMLTSPLVLGEHIRAHGIEVDLPEAKTSESQAAQELVLSISRENEFYVNDLPVAKDALREQLMLAYRQAEQDFLIIRADKGIEYGVLIEIMDIARLAGIYSVSLSTRR